MITLGQLTPMTDLELMREILESNSMEFQESELEHDSWGKLKIIQINDVRFCFDSNSGGGYLMQINAIKDPAEPVEINKNYPTKD